MALANESPQLFLFLTKRRFSALLESLN